METKRAIIEASQPSPYLFGCNVELKCITRRVEGLLSVGLLKTESHFTWYKNDVELRFDESQRIKVCF